MMALWPWPLLGLLHVESSAVVAGVGFFASGWAALALFRRGATLGAATVRLVALLAVPLGLLTLSLLWSCLPLNSARIADLLLRTCGLASAICSYCIPPGYSSGFVLLCLAYVC